MSIDDAHKKEYKRLHDKQTKRKNAQASIKESKKRSSDEYLAGAGHAYAATQKKKKTPPIPFVPGTSARIETPASKISTELTNENESNPSKQQSKDSSKQYHQTT